MSSFKGDYMGFTYNKVHSSELGIVRTSNGSRFDENLLPTIQDKTVQIPGGDGTYYFGSYYTQRQFTIPFAFDNLTEEQFERLRAHFGDKQIHGLVFDERPYKEYGAKVTGTATIKHIPFDEEVVSINESEEVVISKERIYKGEGSIQFTCYSPYAVCKNKYLEDYANCTNLKEWQKASGLLEQGDNDVLRDGVIKLYNPGVKKADYILTLSTKGCLGYEISIDTDTGLLLDWSEYGNRPPEYLIIDSKNNLITGANKVKTESEVEIVPNGIIYNEYMIEGDFFKIPLDESQMILAKLVKGDSEFELVTPQDTDATISYNYYYF